MTKPKQAIDLAGKRARRLAKEGRLIEECYQVFLSHVFPNATPEMIDSLRYAFFGGAQELFALMTAALSEDETVSDDEVTFMEGWTGELEAFYKKQVRAAEGMPAPVNTNTHH